MRTLSVEFVSESSLLMPCYMSHLTQLKCENWHVTAPCVASDPDGLAPFVQMQDGKFKYAGSKYTPYFEPLVDGFTTLAMVDMVSTGGGPSTNIMSSSDSPPSSASWGNTPSQTHFWGTPTGSLSRGEQLPRGHEEQEEEDLYHALLYGEHSLASKDWTDSSDCVTIMVRTKNDINVMVSPMLLEALERFVEAVIPAIERLHPLTIINHLHSQCISRVEKANLLKKEKSILLTRYIA